MHKMTAKLFEEWQWIGEFFVPDQYEKRFPGKISYSPEDGVILSYSITGNELPSESELIHGVLDTGDKCTLVGNFKPHRTGFAVRNGLSTRPGKVGFYCLAVGDFLEPKEVFADLNFSLTTLQEFFFPQGFKDNEKFSDNRRVKGPVDTLPGQEFCSHPGPRANGRHDASYQGLQRWAYRAHCVAADSPAVPTTRKPAHDGVGRN